MPGQPIPFGSKPIGPVPFGTKPIAPVPTPPKPGVLGSIAKSAYDVEKGLATGASKGATSTFLGIGQIGQKIQRGLTSALGAIGIHPAQTPQGQAAAGNGGIFDPTSAAGANAQQIATPQSISEEVGFGAEQAAEYFIPAGGATKAEGLVTAASKGLPKFIAPTARIVGKGLAQGIPAAAVKYAQTGGDAKAALSTGALAGGLRAGVAVVGEGARALHIPERLYSTVFKNTKEDMIAELKSNGIEAIKRTEPELYQELVKSGAVKATNGEHVVNETLAEQAIAKGIKGSTRTMANAVVKGKVKAELAAQTVAKTYKGTVQLPEEQFQNVLKGIAEEYRDVGFGEVSNEATSLAKTLAEKNGALSAEQALQVRRFLDKMRLARSYNQPAAKLSLSQANLKTLADTARARVNAVPGMAPVMKDYSFYIDALETLAKEASRRGNNQVISLIDSILFGSAAASGSVIPATMGVARRVLTTPAGATGVGNLLQREVASPALGGLLGAGSPAAN